jgi:uncharacterized membrane protein
VRVQLDYGEAVSAPLPGGLGSPDVEVGHDVVLIRSETPGGVSYAVVDHQREAGLWLLGLAFVLALVGFGRWRGVAALVGLAATFGMLAVCVIPAILAGSPPVLVAVVGTAAVALVALYVTHGFGLTTTVTVLGTLTSLALTGALSALSVTALHLTGVTDDLSASVGTSQGTDVRGLLLAVIIGSLGVLDDVTITRAGPWQSSLVPTRRRGSAGSTAPAAASAAPTSRRSSTPSCSRTPGRRCRCSS